MKSIKQLLTIGCAGLMIASCSTDDKIVDEVVADTTRGAILRTLSEDGDFDLFRTMNTLDVTVEEQDLEGGALLDRVELTMSFIDNNFMDEENETDRESVSNAPFSTIPASAFSPGASGLPTTSFSFTMAEALSATGTDLTAVLPGDQIRVDLELFLTDGRSFTASDQSGNVSGGSFFSAPHQYTVTIDDGISFEIEDVNANEIDITDGLTLADNEDYAVSLSIDDGDDGNLLQTLNIYREFIDRSIGDDGIDLSEPEALFETYTISDLTLDDGARTLDLTYPLTMLFGGSLTFDDIGVNDEFNLRYEIVTTDGRIITTNAADTEYYDQVIASACVQLNADAPFPGEYTIKYFDSYGDGWNGASLTVDIDGVATTYTLVAGENGEDTFTVPEGTTSLTVTYAAGAWESEVSYVILDPNGNSAAADGPNPAVGVVEILVCE